MSPKPSIARESSDDHPLKRPRLTSSSLDAQQPKSKRPRLSSPSSSTSTIEPPKLVLQEPSERSKIRFKVHPGGLDAPNFYSSCYCVKPTTTDNLITIKVEDFHKYFVRDANFYLCNMHQVTPSGVPSCEYCAPFLEFKYAFILNTQYANYTFPPPVLFVAKTTNYFKTFVRYSTDTQTLKTELAQNAYRRKVFDYYANFMKLNFQGGMLKDIASGKRSFVRNKILGFQSKGIRATLTIDASLGPHYATLPQKIFDALNLATPLMIVNRAPSIKNTCIYVVEVGRNKSVDDYTIHINPFLTEGLHADQDGDELSIFYLEHQSEHPSIDMEMAIVELKRMSWKYGNRHCLGFKPRYQFTQYHKYILTKYNDYFNKHNRLWASLTDEPKIKVHKMMELGCSTHYDEVDEFINLLINFTQKLGPLLTTTQDILNGVGDIQTVVSSGSKGSQDHITEYLRNLQQDNPDNIKNLVEGFNKNITNSSRLGKEGGRQFSLLHAVNPLTLHKQSIYYNDFVLLGNVKHSTTMATFFYNPTAVTECFKSIIRETTEFEFTEQNYKELLAEYI